MTRDEKVAVAKRELSNLADGYEEAKREWAFWEKLWKSALSNLSQAEAMIEVADVVTWRDYSCKQGCCYDTYRGVVTEVKRLSPHNVDAVVMCSDGQTRSASVACMTRTNV